MCYHYFDRSGLTDHGCCQPCTRWLVRTYPPISKDNTDE